jgi:signal transduction histidine kinase
VLLPNEPVTLSVAQVEELNRKLATMRHDINGFVTVMMLSAELMRERPESAEARFKTLSEQPARITEALKTFSAELEAALGIGKH